MPSTMAVSATHTSRSVPSSATKHAVAPSDSASWASSTSSATGRTGSSHTPQCTGGVLPWIRGTGAARQYFLAGGPPRRTSGTDHRLPLVPAAVRRALRRRRVPRRPHPRCRPSAMGHPARRPRPAGVAARRSRAFRRGDGDGRDRRRSLRRDLRRPPRAGGVTGVVGVAGVRPRVRRRARRRHHGVAAGGPADRRPTCRRRNRRRSRPDCVPSCTPPNPMCSPSWPATGRRSWSTPGWTGRTTQRRATSPAPPAHRARVPPDGEHWMSPAARSATHRGARTSPPAETSR